MKLCRLQLALLGADSGMVSMVEESVSRKRRVYAGSDAKEVIFPVYPEHELRAACEESGSNQVEVDFHHYKTGESISILVVFENDFSKMSLESSDDLGFNPQSGEVWFLLESKGHLYIGSMKLGAWQSLATRDDDDQAYQNAIDAGEDTIFYMEYPSLPYPIKKKPKPKENG
jgi:hypothetical protein